MKYKIESDERQDSNSKLVHELTPEPTTQLTTDVVKAEPTTELTTDAVKAAKMKKKNPKGVEQGKKLLHGLLRSQLCN